MKQGIASKVALGSVLALAGTSMAACDVDGPDQKVKFLHFLRMGWPEGITPEAHQLGNFWVWTWVTAWIIGIIMWGIFLYAIFGRWNAKKAAKRGDGEFPRQLQYNIPLELVLTIIPIVIVMGLFLFTVQAQDRATALDKNPQVKVDVTAFQWNWKFGYQEVGKELSPTGSVYNGKDEAREAEAEKNGVNANGNNPIHGRSQMDKSYLHYDKIETVGTTDEVPVLVLPSNTPIEFQLASSDVSHSFWVPEFLFKRDAYPHPEANSSQRAFQVEKIEKEGAFVGRCAEMCGTYHAMMNFEVRVVSPEKFTQYMDYRINHPDAPNSEALKSIGEDPFATTTKPFSSLRDTRGGDNFQDPNSLS
nr:cytochrome c oxidase subunit II [Corynebacterium uropygiale]